MARFFCQIAPQPFLASRGQPWGGRGGLGGGGRGGPTPQPRLAAAWNTPFARFHPRKRVNGPFL